MLNLESQQSTSTFTTKKVVAAVACTGCAVAAIALVGSSSTSSSSLVNIPQSMSGSMVRTNYDGAYNMNLKFNKFEDASGDWVVDAKIVEDYPLRNMQRIITVVNNVAVQENTKNGTRHNISCFGLQAIPATNDIGAAFKSAQVVRADQLSTAAAEQIATCAPGSDKFTMTMFGTSFTGCGETNGKDVSMKVFRPEFTSQVDASADATRHEIAHVEGSPTDCQRFDAKKSMFDALHPEQAARHLAENTEAWPFAEERDLERDMPTVGSNCLFVHGVGQTPSSSEVSSAAGLNTLIDYWGPIRLRAGCTDSHFSWHHSKQWGYNSQPYNTAVCSMITHTGNAINILFTHSMGGMTTAQSFAHGDCTKPSGYYPSQAPLYGSSGANFAYSLSTGNLAYKMACYTAGNCNRRLNYPIQWWNLFHYFLYTGYVSLIQTQTSINSKINLQNGRNNNHWKANRKLCGTTPTGLTTLTSAGLWGISMASWTSNGVGMQTTAGLCYVPTCHWRGCGVRETSCQVPYHDGMVDVNSCGTGLEWASNVLMPVNHEDGACLNDNGTAANQRPCAWYSQRRSDTVNLLTGR